MIDYIYYGQNVEQVVIRITRAGITDEAEAINEAIRELLREQIRRGDK